MFRFDSIRLFTKPVPIESETGSIRFLRLPNQNRFNPVRDQNKTGSIRFVVFLKTDPPKPVQTGSLICPKPVRSGSKRSVKQIWCNSFFQALQSPILRSGFHSLPNVTHPRTPQRDFMGLNQFGPVRQTGFQTGSNRFDPIQSGSCPN